MGPGIVALETVPSDQTAASRIVAGRACGSCSLCCKVVAVEELEKPIGVWCKHCNRQNGCTIYETRPPSCRKFICQWLIAEGLGPEWKPDRAKFALLKSDRGRHVTAFVDPGYPSAWRRPPYYENFKHWAAMGAPNLDEMTLIDVMIGPRCTVVLPDREVELGLLAADDMIQLGCKTTAAGPVFEVSKIKRTIAA
jgi:hypothetical protein